MRRASLTAGVVLLGCGMAPGQTFEVASVRPSPPLSDGAIFFGPPRGGPGTSDPGQITWSGAAMMSLLDTAYDVKPYQVTAPDWTRTERYDIVAKVPPDATKEQVNLMWQNLLKERFGLMAHHVSKDFAADELTVAKGGPKLKLTDLDPNAPEFKPPVPGPGGRVEPSTFKADANGLPQLPGPGLIMMLHQGTNGVTAHMIAKAQTMAQLASQLGNQLGHPVVDKTGLTGRYDFDMEFRPTLNGLPAPPPNAAGLGAPGESAADPGTNLETAIQQLGLRLVKGKAPLDVIVVDHMEKTPIDN